MNLSEYFEFASLFIFLGIWIAISYIGTFKTAYMLTSSWGKSLWKNMPQRGVKFTSAIFLIAGVIFLVFALAQLSNGTFKWSGNPKTYSFSDFLK